MQTAGFALRVTDPEFVQRTRVIPFVHLPTGMPLDVVLAGAGLEDEFLRRAVVTDFNGTRVPVIEIADLVIANVLAGRPKDWDDARALWTLHGPRLDVARIRELLGQLDVALGQSDLVPAFNALVGGR